MDVLALEDRRLDAIGRRTRLHEAEGSRDAFGHHLAQLAGGLDLALAGCGHAFDGQQFAAHLGPGEPGNCADLRLVFRNPVLELAYARKFTQIFGRHSDRRSEEHTSELQSLMRISYA